MAACNQQQGFSSGLRWDPAAVHGDKAVNGAHSNGVTAGSGPNTSSVQARRGQRKPGKMKLPEIHTAPPVAEVDIWEAPIGAGQFAATLLWCFEAAALCGATSVKSRPHLHNGRQRQEQGTRPSLYFEAACFFVVLQAAM